VLYAFGISFNQFSNTLCFSHMLLIPFFKCLGSPLVKHIKFAIVFFSLWMIWWMRNHVRFQKAINIDSTIHIIKKFIRISGNDSNNSMYNNTIDFFILKFFSINTRPENFFSIIQVIRGFLIWYRLKSISILLLQAILE